jgi:glyoxylase-like metal-dependent hydrolase (beta-lactamase superfamily II)
MARGESPLGVTRGRGRVVGLFFPLLERLLGPEPAPPDLALQDGDSLEAYGLPASLLHTPGHTPGSSCLLVQDGLAFAGDLISSTINFHAQRFYAHDWSLIPASLARLAAQRPEKTYTGHGRKALGADDLRKLAAEAATDGKYTN